jgi:hypothetical protein
MSTASNATNFGGNISRGTILGSNILGGIIERQYLRDYLSYIYLSGREKDSLF